MRVCVCVFWEGEGGMEEGKVKKLCHTMLFIAGVCMCVPPSSYRWVSLVFFFFCFVAFA